MTGFQPRPKRDEITVWKRDDVMVIAGQEVTVPSDGKAHHIHVSTDGPHARVYIDGERVTP